MELTRYCTKSGLVYPDSQSFLSGCVKLDNKFGRHSLIINNPTELAMQLLTNSISHTFLNVSCVIPCLHMNKKGSLCGC